jgi:hypothetical protein
MTRQQLALARITQALGYSPEVAADEWLEAVADACVQPEVAQAISDAYRKRDTIGWSRITPR